MSVSVRKARKHTRVTLITDPESGDQIKILMRTRRWRQPVAVIRRVRGQS